MAVGLDIARIDGWVTLAQPRARLIYHRGESLDTCFGGVPARMRLLADHHLVILNLMRDDSDPGLPFAWLATRTDKPCPKGLAALRPVGDTAPVAPMVRKDRHQHPFGPGGQP